MIFRSCFFAYNIKLLISIGTGGVGSGGVGGTGGVGGGEPVSISYTCAALLFLTS